MVRLVAGEGGFHSSLGFLGRGQSHAAKKITQSAAGPTWGRCEDRGEKFSFKKD